MDKQVKSKERVKEFAEVFTNPREINAMLDMIKDEINRIGSRILEPAVGTGNFLVEILSRKLIAIKEKAEGNQLRWEYYVFIAIANIYAIDIQKDNIRECKNRLLKIIVEEYRSLFEDYSEEFINSIKYILSKNIIWGNSLKGMRGDEGKIIFSEWIYDKQNIVRKDYIFLDLVGQDEVAPIEIWEEIHFKRISELN